jgi:hypothetical protein
LRVRSADPLEPLAQRVARRQVAEREARLADDRREQVVEVVRDPAREHTEALEPLHLLHAALERAPLLFLAAPLAEVARHRDEAPFTVRALVAEAGALVPDPMAVVAAHPERLELHGFPGEERLAQLFLHARPIFRVQHAEHRQRGGLFGREAEQLARDAGLERAAALAVDLDHRVAARLDDHAVAHLALLQPRPCLLARGDVA